MIRQRTIEKMLPVPLTAEEFEDRSIELADKTRAARQVAVVIQSEADDWKARKKVLEARKDDLVAEAAALAYDVVTRTRTAPVKCRAVYDFERNRVAYSREDTGEIVDVREMDPEERQLWLDEQDAQLSAEVLEAIDFFERQLAERETNEGEEVDADWDPDTGPDLAEGDEEV